MATIDPLEAILALAQAHPAITALTTPARIAGKHKFANRGAPASARAWKTPSKALVIRYDVGGTQEIYVADQTVRLAAECYGEDEAAAGRVYTALIDLFRSDDRRVVPTSQGNALVRWVVPDGTPLSTRNEDVGIDFIMVALSVCVAEQPV